MSVSTNDAMRCDAEMEAVGRHTRSPTGEMELSKHDLIVVSSWGKSRDRGSGGRVGIRGIRGKTRNSMNASERENGLAKRLQSNES